MTIVELSILVVAGWPASGYVFGRLTQLALSEPVVNVRKFNRRSALVGPAMVLVLVMAVLLRIATEFLRAVAGENYKYL